MTPMPGPVLETTHARAFYRAARVRGSAMRAGGAGA
jgi:hypothetical protein